MIASVSQGKRKAKGERRASSDGRKKTQERIAWCGKGAARKMLVFNMFSKSLANQNPAFYLQERESGRYVTLQGAKALINETAVIMIRINFQQLM